MMKTSRSPSRMPIMIGGLLALSLPATEALAQTCEAGDPQSALQYLRRLSLDLRGRVPDLREIDEVLAAGHVEPALIERMIQSDELVRQTERMHRDLLWTNITDQRLTNNQWQVQAPGNRGRFGVIPAYTLAAPARAQRYRGDQYASCLDQPAQRDEETGEILTTPDPTDPMITREGWVEVQPYWAMGTTIKVCAFDAQDNLTGLDPGGRTVDCSSGVNSKQCGCGPNLRWCESLQDNTKLKILSSMDQQLLRFANDIVKNDRPYTDLLKGKDMEINGPISFWLRTQTQIPGGTLVQSAQQNYPVPELPFEATDTWVKVDRGERHSGVLSMPSYLVKFQSDRGRANRFYNAFLCQHFEPRTALPPSSDPCHQELDLTQRCGCKDCHVALEPAAAHWGRWAEAGLMPLNVQQYPKYNGCCTTPRGACPPGQMSNAALCQRFYITAREAPRPDSPMARFLGVMKPYVFADAAIEANIAGGPEKIADEAIASGEFAACTAKRLWTQFMAHNPAVEDQARLEEITAGFKQGYSLRKLIREIVTSDQYIEAGNYKGSM